jgi:hypothetical protein
MGMDSAVLLNLPARPAHHAIAGQNLGSIKEMHYQHHGSALTGGAFLLGHWLDLQVLLHQGIKSPLASVNTTLVWPWWRLYGCSGAD